MVQILVSEGTNVNFINTVSIVDCNDNLIYTNIKMTDNFIIRVGVDYTSMIIIMIMVIPGYL